MIATNAEVADGGLRGSTVVQWQVLQSAVEGVKGRRILFIDTCHSGDAYNPRLGNAAYHANIIAYTAARFDQTARADDKSGHRLFTYVMVEGLEGKGGIAQRWEITTELLADYVIKRVEELAKAQGPRRSRSTSRGAMPRAMSWRDGEHRSAPWLSEVCQPSDEMPHVQPIDCLASETETGRDATDPGCTPFVQRDSVWHAAVQTSGSLDVNRARDCLHPPRLRQVDDARGEAALAAVEQESSGTVADLARGGLYPSPEADPIYLYCDVLIGIVPERGLTIGMPPITLC